MSVGRISPERGPRLAARSDHLSQLSKELVSRVNLGFSTEPYSEALHEVALTQHKALVEAVCSGEQDRAADIAREHFQQTTSDAWRSVLLRANEDASASTDKQPSPSV